MAKSLGMIEFKTVSSGVFAADKMVKSADIKMIEAQVVCPGKYIALFEGSLSAIQSAVDVVKTSCSQSMISTFVMGNPNPDLFPAIYGTTHVEKMQALGVLETYDGASAIVAADEAVKTAAVHLIELRIAKGMCGKSYFTLTGEIAAVEAAINRAKQSASESGMYLDSQVIAQVDPQISKSLL